MKQYLFTYGTLQPGSAPAEIAGEVGRLRWVGRGFVRGHRYDLGDYPGAVLREDGNEDGEVIAGWICELPDDPDVLDRLDKYEEFDPANLQGSLFVRKESTVTFDNGAKIRCWIYVYNRDPGASPSIAGDGFSKGRSRETRS